MEVPRILAFQHAEVRHDLKADSQDLFVTAQRVRSDRDGVTLLDEGDVHYCGHGVRLYSTLCRRILLKFLVFVAVHSLHFDHIERLV
jgi:hypothetical protein